jgi:hypothetical protein
MSKIYVLVFEKKNKSRITSKNLLVSTDISEIMDALNGTVFKEKRDSLRKTWQEDLFPPGYDCGSYRYFKTWYNTMTEDWLVIQEWPDGY